MPELVAVGALILTGPALTMTAEAKRIAANLPGTEHLMLLCVASGANWRRAGITPETAEQMVAQGLIRRDYPPSRFKLTRLGRNVLVALLVPPADDA
jgi:hypothetical protein